MRTLGRRTSAAGLVGSLVAVLLALPPTPSGAAAGPTVDGPTRFAPSADFATQRLADPWDYANPEDMLTDGRGPTLQVSGARVADGRFAWDSDTGYVSPLFVGVDGALPDHMDGVTNPIDADTYTHASLRLYVSRPTQVALVWFTCTAIEDPACRGRGDWNLPDAGWHTLTFDLRRASSPFAADHPQPWSGDVRGLRLASGAGQTHLELDWLRLHPAPTRTAPVRGGSDVVWDLDTDPGNNEPREPGWGPVDGAGFPVDVMPPGAYHLYDRASATYGDTITVVDAARPVIHDPDVTGGADWATVVRGDPWDMASSGDVTRVANATDVRVDDGRLAGTNTTNDPFVVLDLDGRAVDGARYHRLTVTTEYAGTFDLADAVGGGTHGRLVFRRPDTAPVGSSEDSRELVTFTDRDTYTYDLRGAAAVEPGSLPFDTAPVTQLRWDPNEDRGARRWVLDDLRLAADDEAAGSFTVRWTDPSHRDGRTVEIGLDTDRDGFDGPVVARGVVQRLGENAITVDTTGVRPGTRHLWVRGTDPDGVQGASYATGPLVVTARLAGVDREATAVQLSRAAFPDGADTVVVAASRAFPDALAASQLAVAANAPLLLTPGGALDADVAAELRRLGPSTAVVLGGERAVTSAVEDQVAAVVDGEVARVAGTTRYDTAARIARRTLGLAPRDGAIEVLLADGEDFPDALAAGQLVAADGRLLLLTGPSGLHPRTREVLADVEVARVTAVGGTAALPEDVLGAAGAACGCPTDRLAGVDRYETAAAIAAAAVRAGADGRRVLLANGTTYPDALAAGPHLGATGGILLLTAPTSLATATAAALPRDARDVVAVGGRGTVADEVLDAARRTAGL